ncbi:MAG TPA: serine/threonine protein kinase, partial [Stellaceae bacterium]|nr:serine/threonine protein kinase [Stellaceae bacterium]
DEAPLALCVDLVSSKEIERLPKRRFDKLLELAVPLIALSAFEVSATAKLRFALRAFSEEGLPAIVPP